MHDCEHNYIEYCKTVVMDTVIMECLTASFWTCIGPTSRLDLTIDLTNILTYLQCVKV